MPILLRSPPVHQTVCLRCYHLANQRSCGQPSNKLHKTELLTAPGCWSSAILCISWSSTEGLGIPVSTLSCNLNAIISKLLNHHLSSCVLSERDLEGQTTKVFTYPHYTDVGWYYYRDHWRQPSLMFALCEQTEASICSLSTEVSWCKCFIYLSRRTY